MKIEELMDLQVEVPSTTMGFRLLKYKKLPIMVSPNIR